MAGHKWKRRYGRPITVSGMEVGVTDAGRNHLDQNFAPPGRRNRHFLDAQSPAKFVHHSRSHRPCHACISNVFLRAKILSCERAYKRRPDRPASQDQSVTDNATTALATKTSSSHQLFE